MLREVAPHRCVVPRDERVDLHEFETLVPFDDRFRRTRRRLIAAKPSHPGVVRAKKGALRLDLPKGAAGLRVASPQRVTMRGILLGDGLLGPNGDRHDAVVLRDPIDERIRFVEE